MVSASRRAVVGESDAPLDHHVAMDEQRKPAADQHD